MERAVSKVCPPWLRSQRDDIVQAALIRVWEVQKRNSGRTSLARGYLSRVAHSVLIDEIRKTQRQMESPLENDGGTVSLSTGDPDPECKCAGLEIGSGIRICLGKLHQSRRLAVTLHLLGHSVPESAKLLGWTSKKTENLVYRGLKSLRLCLRRNGIEP